MVSEMKSSNAPTPTSRILSLTLPSLALAGGLGALEYLRSRFQHRRMFVPDRFPNGIWEPARYGVPAQDVWFSAADGTALHGWWIPLRRAVGALLFCHGNSGSIAHQVGVLRLFRLLRWSVLAFDYRGYGKSEGSPSEKGLFQDVRAAYAHLTEELGQSAEKLMIFGHSLGGAVAIDAALECPATGLVVQSSFTDSKDMARAFYPNFPVHWIARNHFRSIDKVERLQLPKLFIHGTEDGTIPFEVGQRLYEAAAEPKDFYEVPRAGHNDVHLHGGLRYMWALRRFRNRCLRRKSETVSTEVEAAEGES